MKATKKYIVIALLQGLWIMPNVLFAQQVAQHTLNSLNKYIVNPAIVGTEDFIDFKASYRTQWVGLESAPKTSYFSAHMPLGHNLGSSHNHRRGEKKSWVGIGTLISRDVTGPSKRVNAYATSSYNVPLNNRFRASFGLSLGIQNYSFDGSNIALIDQNDVMFTSSQSIMSPDAQAGVWIYSEEFYIGVSAQQLFKNRLDFYDGVQSDSASAGSYLNRHVFVSSGVNLEVSEHFTLTPSVLIKLIFPAPASVDLGLMLRYEDKYWAGAFARAGDSFSLVVGTLVQHAFSISYGYDLNYSSLSPFNSGSHEILLGFRWPPKNRLDCPSKFWN